MRNINVVKYRKLLYEIQQFCKISKLNIWKNCVLPKKRQLTDYERGCLAGQQKAYNEVLRQVGAMIDSAEYDWNSVYCREEENKI